MEMEGAGWRMHSWDGGFGMEVEDAEVGWRWWEGNRRCRMGGFRGGMKVSGCGWRIQGAEVGWRIRDGDRGSRM